MNKANAFVALLVGASLALGSVLMIQAPDQIGDASIVLFPGFILGMVTSGNIHDFNVG